MICKVIMHLPLTCDRKSFDTPPVGPLYETISMNTELEQENFGQALIVDVVESLFKFDMNTFLVNTQQDVNSMRQILSKNRRNDVRVIKVPFYEKDKRTRKRRFPLSKTVCCGCCAEYSCPPFLYVQFRLQTILILIV